MIRKAETHLAAELAIETAQSKLSTASEAIGTGVVALVDAAKSAA